MLLEHDEMRVDQKAAVECGERHLELQWLDEHRHAPRWTAARDGKEHARRLELADSRDGPLGQGLLRRHERPIDIGEQEPDRRCRDAAHKPASARQHITSRG